MQNANEDISCLNGLITTTIDSVDGYREAAKDASNPTFRTIFIDRANERDGIVSELQAEVRALGGNPDDSGSALAGAHRMFLNLREAIAGGDDKAVIAEVERGEDHIKAKYEAALTDADLSPNTVSTIQRCYQSVKEGHDQMRDLKHGVSTESTY
jgi:uncharacterized protein (TIGR02284 family)